MDFTQQRYAQQPSKVEEQHVGVGGDRELPSEAVGGGGDDGHVREQVLHVGP